VSNLPVRLLSPQHWGQANRLAGIDTTPKGTRCITDEDEITLLWADRKYRKTIPLSNHSRVGVLQSAPGFQKFKAFCSLIEEEDVAFSQPHIIEDDEVETSLPAQEPTNKQDLQPNRDVSTTQFTIPVTDGNPLPVVEDEENERIELDNASHELLLHHYRLGHTPFSKLPTMGRNRDLPKRLSTCRVPQCPPCHCGHATNLHCPAK